MLVKWCACVILYFYPATCGPKGHGSCLSNGGGLFIHDHFLSQNELIGPSRAPLSLPPLIAGQRKEKNGQMKRQRKRIAYPLAPQRKQEKYI